MSGAVTREDVQDEFRSLLHEALSQEFRTLSEQMHRDVKKEMRRFFDEEFWARRSRCSSPIEERDNRVQTPPTQLCAPLNMPMPPLGSGALEDESMYLRHTAHATDELMAFDDFNHAPIAGWAKQDNDIDFVVDEKDGNTGSRRSSKGKHNSDIDKVHPAPEEGNSCYSNSDEDSYRRSGYRLSNATQRSNRASYCSKYSEQIEVMPGDLPNNRAPDQMFEAWLPEKIRHTIGGRRSQSSKSAGSRNSSKSTEESGGSGDGPGWLSQEIFTVPSGIYDKTKGKFSCSRCVVAAIKSEYFDYLMGAFLLLNGLSIGIQVNYMAGQESGEVPTTFRIIDGTFCGVFLFELLARFGVYRCNYFYMRGWQWNVFDLVVVVLQVGDELMKLFLEGTKVQETLDSGGGSKVLRVIRLARLVRLLRMVRLIPELKSMVYLISASMWSFFWTAVLLLMLIFCVAVYFTELSTDLVREEKVTEEESLIIKGHYGSIGNSIISLWQAISGGDDWRNFVDPFQADGSYVQNAMVFSAYVGFATLVMLNLVTGVFVEGAQRIVQTDKDTELTRHVRRLFNSTDTDDSGEISWEEFEAQLESSKMESYLKQVEIGTNEAKALFKLLDTDRSGEVSVEEFVQGCLRLRGPARSMDLNALKYDFDEVTAMWGRRFITIDLNIRALKQMMEQLARASMLLPVEHILV